MDKKTAYLDSAIAVFTKLGDLDGLGLAYNVNGSMLMEYGSLEQAKASYEKAYDYYVQSGNKERQAVILKNWGVTLNMMGNPKEAMLKYDQALTFRLQQQPESPLQSCRGMTDRVRVFSVTFLLLMGVRLNHLFGEKKNIIALTRPVLCTILLLLQVVHYHHHNILLGRIR